MLCTAHSPFQISQLKCIKMLQKHAPLQAIVQPVASSPLLSHRCSFQSPRVTHKQCHFVYLRTRVPIGTTSDLARHRPNLEAVPWLTLLVAGFSPLRPGFKPRPAHERLAMDKVPYNIGFMKQGFLLVLRLSMSLQAPIPHSHHGRFLGGSVGHGLVIEAARSYPDTPHSLGLLCTTLRPLPDKTQH
jgi:hypothetical protein